mgnify:CR=1 FL=1
MVTLVGDFPTLDNSFSVWTISVVFKMPVDQLNAGKNMWVKNIRFKKKFFNYFLQDRFYKDVEFYGWKDNGKIII